MIGPNNGESSSHRLQRPLSHTNCNSVGVRVGVGEVRGGQQLIGLPAKPPVAEKDSRSGKEGSFLPPPGCEQLVVPDFLGLVILQTRNLRLREVPAH